MPAINFDTVRKIGLTLPRVKENTSRGVTSLKIDGKLMTWPPINKSAEPDSIAVRINVDDRAELLAAAPETYYVTDHYVNYPCVLVRLSRIRTDALRDLLLMSWKFVTSNKPAKRRRLQKPNR
jgi:hypothetical protein